MWFIMYMYSKLIYHIPRQSMTSVESVRERVNEASYYIMLIRVL